MNDRHRQIIAMYQSGMRQFEIARHFGITRPAVRNVIVRQEVAELESAPKVTRCVCGLEAGPDGRCPLCELEQCWGWDDDQEGHAAAPGRFHIDYAWDGRYPSLRMNRVSTDQKDPYRLLFSALAIGDAASALKEATNKHRHPKDRPNTWLDDLLDGKEAVA